MADSRLEPRQLSRRCDPATFDFETTAELEELKEFVGQSRALEAVRFGVGIERDGYNLYAMGPSPRTSATSTTSNNLTSRAR